MVGIPWNVSIGQKGGSLTTTVNPLTDTTAIPWNISLDGRKNGRIPYPDERLDRRY